MKLYGWFKDLHDEVKDTFDYKLASLELDITERIIQKMQGNMALESMVGQGTMVKITLPLHKVGDLS
jgi:signal transduction histidine kinase